MQCLSCKTDNPPDAAFCEQCGSKLEVVCPACKAEVSPGARFCKKCGTAIAASGPASVKKSTDGPIRIADVTAAENIDGERKVVTFLFADIKGSMDLMEDLDPEEARAIVDPALKLMMEAVHHYGGYVAQPTGDGIFALFGAPIAHEDHPQRALFAALRLQEEMRRYSAKLRVAGNLPVEARVGVNTGEVVVRSIATGPGNVEYAPIGHSTGLAARMQALAPTGSIAATNPVRKLCEGYFTFKTLGPTKVKGVTEPVDVYEVTGFGPLRTRLQRSANRGYTKFVGREREMEALGHAAGLAAQGRGQIVAGVGEPGVGKSRLFFEFKARLQSGWMVLEAPSVSHGRTSAFLPLIDLLWSYFKIIPDDDERTRREKITGRVVALDPSLEEALPYVYSLLGVSTADSPITEIESQTRKRRTLDAVKRILLRESLNQPLIVEFEDLHTVDDQTQGFLNLFADGLGTSKILMLVNYRPDYVHPWGSKTYYTQLRLDPLGPESADEMLAALVGERADLVPLKRLIVDRTEGNPLFIEEIYQALIEDGVLVRDGAGVRLAKSLSQLKIPSTVRDIIAARIDGLRGDEKDFLQTLAVIGREFPLALARNIINQPDDEIERMLDHLQLAEFIYEQPAAGDIEYTFKHALTRDVAYHSVLLERRKVLHERIGTALKSLHVGKLDNHLSELAYHFAHSGNAEKAVEFSLRACQQCVERGSFIEAVAHFETGLEMLPSLPDDDRRVEIELNLRITVQYAFQATRGYASSDVEEFARRAVELSQRLGVKGKKAWLALYGLGGVLHARGDPRGACQIAAKLLAPAEELGSIDLILQCLHLDAFASMNMGEFERAGKDFDRAIALLESTPPARLARGAFSPFNLAWPSLRAVSGWNLWYLGYPDRAQERVNRAIAAARKSDTKASIETAINMAGVLYHLLGDVDRLRDCAQASLELATQVGNPFHRLLAEFFLGWTEVMANDFHAGITRMRRYLAEFRADRAGVRVPQYLAMMAAALGKSGEPGKGLSVIEESIAVMERSGERFYEAEVHRLKGELLLVQDASNEAQAEPCFRTAIEISRKQRAKSWELRATTSLVQLLVKQGKRDEARATLANIYNWFTEGFDTADLKHAKALLEELKS
jgi:class 3 adenylate cyclase/tetratricopeptide (TPR) repeat protein